MTALACVGFLLAGLLAILASARALDTDASEPKPETPSAVVPCLLFALCLASVIHAHVQKKREEEERD